MRSTSWGRRPASSRAVLVVIITGLLAAVIGPPAQAADDPPRLTLSVSIDPTDGVVVAGAPVTFTYTVSNDTGAALDVAGGGVVAYLGLDASTALPVARDCSFVDYWTTHAFPRDTWDGIARWDLDLPETVAPGPVATCSLTVMPSAADVALGGLWTMLTFQRSWELSTAPDQPQLWNYSSWGLKPAREIDVSPSIEGTPAVGSTLTVRLGLWPFTSDSISDIQWIRNGVPLDAWGTEYTPVAADAGAEISAEVSAMTGITRTTAPVVVSRFVDVQSSYPFASYIAWLAGKGISTGYAQPDGSWQFRPTTAVSREAMAAFLFRDIAPGGYTPPVSARFSDVPTSYPFYTNVAWLAQQGISTGYADGTFKPTDAVTREAMAAFLFRAAGSPAYTPPATPRFSDVPTTYPFYKQISWLAAQGISTGYADGTFKPTAAVTREAMAAFLQRADPIYHPVG